MVVIGGREKVSGDDNCDKTGDQMQNKGCKNSLYTVQYRLLTDKLEIRYIFIP